MSPKGQKVSKPQGDSEAKSQKEEQAQPSKKENKSPKPQKDVDPQSEEWDNSVAVCAIMKQEKLSDIREWLLYHQCAPCDASMDCPAARYSPSPHTPCAGGCLTPESGSGLWVGMMLDCLCEFFCGHGESSL